MFNLEPLRVQLMYARWLFKQVADAVSSNGIDYSIYAVLGNHDVGYSYGNLLDLIKMRGLRIVYDTLILKSGDYRIVCKHQLNRYSRGSYLTWLSGYLLNLDEKLLEMYHGNVLVTAHTHRPDIAIVNWDDKLFIGLPAYIISNEDYKYNKAIVFRNGWIHVIIKNKHDKSEVI